MSHNTFQESSFHSSSERLHQHHLRSPTAPPRGRRPPRQPRLPGDNAKANPVNPALAVPLTNGLDLDLEEVGVDTVPYPRKLALIKQLAKSVIIGWESPLVPAGWGSVFSFNIYVDDELRLNVPFGAQTKAVLERLDFGAEGVSDCSAVPDGARQLGSAALQYPSRTGRERCADTSAR